MNSAAGQRSFTITIVPACQEDKIIVNVHTGSINSSAHWERIAPMHTKNGNTACKFFVGTVVAVGKDVPTGRHKVRDTVAGVIEGAWIDNLDHPNQKYLGVYPDQAWHISAETAKKFGLVDHAVGDGCTIV